MTDEQEIAESVAGSGPETAKDSVEYEKLGEDWDGGYVPESLDPETYNKFTDRFGREFDTELHVHDENGRPKVTGKRYNLVTRPGKMPDQLEDESDSKGSGETGDAGDRDPDGEDKGPDERQGRPDYEMNAWIIQEGLQNVSEFLLGTEDDPEEYWEMGKQEQEKFTRYWIKFHKNRFPDKELPAWILLTMSIVGYEQRRVQERHVQKVKSLTGQNDQEIQESEDA